MRAFFLAVSPLLIVSALAGPAPGQVARTVSPAKAQTPPPPAESQGEPKAGPTPAKEPDWKVATFGAGCFWCTEAVFEQVKGVGQVVSGFSGGQWPNPTYQQVLTGQTGHAEVCQIAYDPEVISYTALLEIFWRTHDPTTLNQQGPDFGTQYRSVVFYHDAEQKEQAEQLRNRLDAAGVYPVPVVTEIVPFAAFFPAEKYHQDYYRKNRRASYCTVYITPKLQKFKKVFKDKLK
jgi:peptide-methionine (S)-S-oxide reductase